MNSNTIIAEASKGKTITDSKLIFLAEDDLDDQELLIEAFTNLDTETEIFTIANGNKAIGLLEKMADNQLPNLIILDYNLPEVNGGQILEILQKDQRYHPIPKVIWSTSNSPMYQSQCLSLGARAYLVKPSDIKGIQNMAQQMLSFCKTEIA